MKTKIIIMALLVCNAIYGQTAKSVLDKTAATVSVKEGLKASFKMTGTHGNTSGSVAVKGKKFYATTPQATVWFDGKTMWTYMKNNDEVNISSPTQAQLLTLNPYTFINLYKRGYNYTLNKSGKDYVVHLTASDANTKIKEKWLIFDITNLKKESVPDAQFRFNSKDFPSAEIIDLR